MFGDNMATLRKWLTEEGFNFATGRIVYHKVEDDSSPGWGTAIEASLIPMDHPILDYEFNDGFGGPNCPRIIAEDSEAYYFPSQYDGATSLEKLYKNIERYLDIKIATPYPGG